MKETLSRPRVQKTLRIAARAVKIYLLLVAALGILYFFVPPVSTLMLGRWLTFQQVDYRPVRLEEVSEHLIRAVVRAEDAKFCRHTGVDWESLWDAIAEGGLAGPTRGASTIPMQVAKNLFLWPQQSYVRKAVEMPIAMYLNVVWSKRRMLEVYLSIAQWGEGIYGAEAAARTYFRKSAKHLSRHEAALLAAALPNPAERDPRRPGEYHASYAANLMRWANADVDLTCLK